MISPRLPLEGHPSEAASDGLWWGGTRCLVALSLPADNLRAPLGAAASRRGGLSSLSILESFVLCAQHPSRSHSEYSEDLTCAKKDQVMP